MADRAFDMLQLDLFDTSFEDRLSFARNILTQQKLEYDHCEEQLNRHGWVDEDGYPTKEALHYIATFPFLEYDVLMKQIEQMWWGKAYGSWETTQDDTSTKYSFSTVGWSGNESIIRAMKQNEGLWDELFVQETRGGHFILTDSY